MVKSTPKSALHLEDSGAVGSGSVCVDADADSSADGSADSGADSGADVVRGTGSAERM